MWWFAALKVPMAQAAESSFREIWIMDDDIEKIDDKLETVHQDLQIQIRGVGNDMTQLAVTAVAILVLMDGGIDVFLSLIIGTGAGLLWRAREEKLNKRGV